MYMKGRGSVGGGPFLKKLPTAITKQAAWGRWLLVTVSQLTTNCRTLSGSTLQQHQRLAFMFFGQPPSPGGAIATGTHGSSFVHGSLSSQVSDQGPAASRCTRIPSARPLRALAAAT
jgi:hypothetical protein